MMVSNEGLLPGLEEVGRRFEKNLFFLPQVMRSAETMQRAFARLKEELHGAGMQTAGRILMATVEGDIHDINDLACTLLENHGFEVVDLGKNVSAGRIVAEAERLNVDAVGLSALMTTTMAEMENVLEKLKATGVKTFTAWLAGQWLPRSMLTVWVPTSMHGTQWKRWQRSRHLRNGMKTGQQNDCSWQAFMIGCNWVPYNWRTGWSNGSRL